MKNNIRNIFSVLLSRIINKPVFGKVVIIFIVGFASRFFINNINIINIFLDYFNYISILYYILFSVFIVLVHEFVDYFSFSFSFSSIIYTSFVEFIGYIVRMFGLMNFRIFSIRLGDIKLSSIIKGASNRTLNSKSIKIYSVLDRNNEIKLSGKTILGEKACSRYRPVKSSPLSNFPITPANINEMNPIRETIFSGKTNSSLPSVSFNHSATPQIVSTVDVAFQERNNDIIRYKDEFKVFYTTYRESIKLSDYELESLSIKIAIENDQGRVGLDVLPEDIKPLYRKYLRKALIQKIKPIN
jgi:hypothetical protein